MNNAWVDAINGVEGSWSNLGQTVIHEIEGIIAKTLIVIPLMRELGDLSHNMGWENLADAFWKAGGGTAGGSSGGSGDASGWISTAMKLYFSGLFADGGDPPVGQVAVVGEQGPELFVPKTSGTVIPAGRTAALLGQNGGGTYYIDARGADRTGLAQLYTLIQKVNGSIERRAVGAVVAAKNRSAPLRRNFLT